MLILDASLRHQAVPSLARWCLGAGIAATIGANLAHGLGDRPIGALVSAWPALALTGSFGLLMTLIRTEPCATYETLPVGHEGQATPKVEPAAPLLAAGAPAGEQTVRARHSAGRNQRAIARELGIDRRKIKPHHRPPHLTPLPTRAAPRPGRTVNMLIRVWPPGHPGGRTRGRNALSRDQTNTLVGKFTFPVRTVTHTCACPIGQRLMGGHRLHSATRWSFGARRQKRARAGTRCASGRGITLCSIRRSPRSAAAHPPARCPAGPGRTARRHPGPEDGSPPPRTGPGRPVR